MDVKEAKAVLKRHGFTPGKSRTTPCPLHARGKRGNMHTTVVEGCKHCETRAEVKAACAVLRSSEQSAQKPATVASSGTKAEKSKKSKDGGK